MKVILFTQGDGEDSRLARELAAQLESEKYEVEYLDTAQAECASKMTLYDVYSYPTFVVVRDDGQMVECWRGRTPLRNDILNFLNL